MERAGYAISIVARLSVRQYGLDSIGGLMTQAELLQADIMNRFWGRLTNLTNEELMTRRQMEIEQGHNLKAINAEINRRNREI